MIYSPKRLAKSKVSGNMKSIEKAKRNTMIQSNTEQFLQGMQTGSEWLITNQDGRLELQHSPSKFVDSNKVRDLQKQIEESERQMAALKTQLANQKLKTQPILEEPTQEEIGFKIQKRPIEYGSQTQRSLSKSATAKGSIRYTSPYKQVVTRTIEAPQMSAQKSVKNIVTKKNHASAGKTFNLSTKAQPNYLSQTIATPRQIVTNFVAPPLSARNSLGRTSHNFANSSTKKTKPQVTQPEIIPSRVSKAARVKTRNAKPSVIAYAPNKASTVPKSAKSSPKMIRIADPKYSDNWIRVTVEEANRIRKQQDEEESFRKKYTHKASPSRQVQSISTILYSPSPKRSANQSPLIDAESLVVVEHSSIDIELPQQFAPKADEKQPEKPLNSISEEISPEPRSRFSMIARSYQGKPLAQVSQSVTNIQRSDARFRNLALEQQAADLQAEFQNILNSRGEEPREKFWQNEDGGNDSFYEMMTEFYKPNAKHDSPTTRLRHQKDNTCESKDMFRRSIATPGEYQITYVPSPERADLIQPGEELNYNLAYSNPVKFMDKVLAKENLQTTLKPRKTGFCSKEERQECQAAELQKSPSLRRKSAVPMQMTTRMSKIVDTKNLSLVGSVQKTKTPKGARTSIINPGTTISRVQEEVSCTDSSDDK